MFSRCANQEAWSLNHWHDGWAHHLWASDIWFLRGRSLPQDMALLSELQTLQRTTELSYLGIHLEPFNMLRIDGFLLPLFLYETNCRKCNLEPVHSGYAQYVPCRVAGLPWMLLDLSGASFMYQTFFFEGCAEKVTYKPGSGNNWERPLKCQG